MDLMPLVEYVEAHLAGDLSLEALARRSGWSPYHLHRRFHAAVGEPPQQYVRRLRLERAAVWLKLSTTSVTAIALGAGYASHEGFTRAFRARFGVSPRRYRASLAAGDLPSGFAPRMVTLPALRVAYTRHVGPYDGSEAALAQLAEWAARRGVLGSWMLVIYLDHQEVTAPEHTRFDAALVVGAQVDGEGEIKVRELPAADYAVFPHAGDVSERRRFYEATFRTWLPSIGRRAAGRPPFEAYGRTADGIEMLSTQVHIPLIAR